MHKFELTSFNALDTLKAMNCNLFMPSLVFNLCTFHVICESVIIAMTDDIDYESLYLQFVYAFYLFIQKMTDNVKYEHCGR